MAKKRKKNKLKTYSFIISIVLLILTLSNLYCVIKINVFPIKYQMILYFLFLLAVIIVFSLFKINNKSNKKRTFLSFFATLFSIAFLIVFLYFCKTFGFLNNIMQKNYEIENYIVVVNKSSIYSDINDLKNKNISYVDTDIYHINDAIAELKNKVNTSFNKKENYEFLLAQLYDEQTDAILLEESYAELLISESSNNDSLYSTFSDETKIIYRFELKIKQQESDIKKDIDVTDEPFNIYISGIDTYGAISSVSRSDVNIVVTVNPKTKQILLTSIPRDYYVKLNGTTGYKDKLTHAGIYGIDKSVKTIEDLLEIDINYYIKVNFTSLIKIVEAVGGIDVYSEYEFSGKNYTFKKGYNYMNGQQALEFSRTRKTLSGGDRARGKNQEAVIAALIKKICSKSIIVNYMNILDSLSDSFITNLSQNQITSLVKMQLNDMSEFNVTSISLDGTNAFDYTYSYQNQKLYVMIPIESTIKNAQEKIEMVFEGKILESSYAELKESSNTVSEKNNNENILNNISDNKQNISNEQNVSINTEINNSYKNNNESLQEQSNSIIVEDVQEKQDINEELKEEQNCTLVDGICLEQYEEIIETNV